MEMTDKINNIINEFDNLSDSQIMLKYRLSMRDLIEVYYTIINHSIFINKNKFIKKYPENHYRMLERANYLIKKTDKSANFSFKMKAFNLYFFITLILGIILYFLLK